MIGAAAVSCTDGRAAPDAGEGSGRASRPASDRRSLRHTGPPIGDFDVLIAATALDADAELTTANQHHFGRVEGLSVRGYR